MASGELGKVYVTISAKIDDLQKALGEVKKELGGTKEEAEKANKSFKDMAKGFTDAGKAMSITGAAITASLGLIIKQSVNLGDTFNDLSQRTGISVETLSSFKLAADKSGTSIEGFATGMRGLANKMQDASTKGGDSAKMFKSLHVSIKNADGSLRPLDQVMLDVADRFSSMEDGAQKTAIAQDLFGKSGMALIPMLNLGRKGLEDEAEAARRLGIVMSKEDAAAADAFNDSLTELQASLQGVGQQITTQLLPDLTSIVKTVTDVVAGLSAWAKEHPGLTKAISGTVLALGGLLTGAGSFIFVVGTLMTKLAALATAFHMTTAAIAISTAGIGTLVLAMATAIGYIWAMKSAQDELQSAYERSQEAEKNLSEKLYEAAKAVGMTNKEFMLLTKSYGDNVAALARAIKDGKEGKDLQEALARVSKKHREEIERLRREMLGLGKDSQALAEELKLITKVELEESLKKYKDALIQYGRSMPFAEQEKLKKQIEDTEKQLSQISNTARASAIPLRGLQDTTMKLALGFELAEKEGERFGNALKMQGTAVKVWGGSLEDALSTLENVADEAIKIGALMDLGKWGGWKEAPKAAKEATSEISTIITNFVQDLSRDLVGVFGLDKIFGFKAEDFDDSYFERALSEAEDFFDAQRKQYDDALDGIRDYYDEIEKASRKRYDDERDLVGEQYDEIYKTKRREYEDQRDWIEENVKDETQRKAMLKKLDRDYEDSIDDLKRQEKEKLKAMEEAHQAELDRLRNEQKAKEEQLQKDLVALEEAKKLEMDRIRADEDKARDDLAAREEKRQNSLWTRLKETFGKVCEDLLGLYISRFIEGLIGEGVTKGLESAAKAVKDTIGGAVDTAAGAAGSLGSSLLSSLGSIGSIISGLMSIVDYFSPAKPQTDVTYWLKMIKDNSQIIVNYLADTLVPATHNIEMLSYNMRDFLNDIKLTSWDQTEQLYKIAENTYGTWQALKGVIPAQSGVNTTVSRPTLFMAHAGERVNISPNINMNMQAVPINLNINGKAFLRAVASDIYEMSKTRELKIHSNSSVNN